MYGLTVWGYAQEASISSLQVLQNKAIRIIGSLRKDSNINFFCKKNSILKIDELHRLEMYKIMWNYEQNNLPNCFKGIFTYVGDVHDYETRLSVTHKMSENIAVDTQCGKCSLRFQGPKIANHLKEMPFYQHLTTKHSLAMNIKKHFLTEY